MYLKTASTERAIWNLLRFHWANEGPYGYVRFLESKEKKNAMENNFLMFGHPIENTKENQI